MMLTTDADVDWKPQLFVETLICTYLCQHVGRSISIPFLIEVNDFAFMITLGILATKLGLQCFEKDKLKIFVMWMYIFGPFRKPRRMC